MDLHLFQKDTAKLFNVSLECVTNWETGRAKPQIQFYPKIISFLGFNPFELNITTLGGRIRKYRYEHGLSYKALGKLLDVDASTVQSWELDQSKPHFEALKNIKILINDIYCQPPN